MKALLIIGLLSSSIFAETFIEKLEASEAKHQTNSYMSDKYKSYDGKQYTENNDNKYGKKIG